jgi:hypothetical protein
VDAAPFCGRETELAALEDAWRAVRAGGGPRAVVLLGDRGLGKTRLVQAFYARAVAEAQPDGGYWPAALGAEGRNLQVVPDEGAWRLEAPMPFLWWGVRLADPHGHNHPPAGVLAGAVERDLLPHLDAVHREQRRRARRAAALGVGRGVVVDAVADVVADLIPFGGLLKTLGETGRELQRIAEEGRRDRGPSAAADLTATRRQGLVDKLMADLEALLGGPEGARVPAVLIVDDAQFAPTDPGVTAFVETLVPAAAESGWPLLLVVTSWVREWLVQRERADPSVASALRRWGAATELRLAPVADLTPAVRAAFPGLHDGQVAAVADRAGGNPRLLDELLRFLGDVRRRPSFVGRDPTGPLTDAGLEALARHTGDLHQLVAERLAEAPDAVQHAVALAAGQGSEFLPAVVRATAIALEPAGAGAGRSGDDGAVGDALAAAEHPHAFVTTTGPALAAFVQRVYAEVAREFLDALVEPDALAAAVRDALRTCAAAGLDAELPADAADGFYALVATTFEGAAAVDDRRFAAQALRGLVDRAVARDDLTGLAVLAPRLADVLDGLPETHLDGDLRDVREAAWVLGLVGDRGRQRAQLLRWFGLVAETFEEHRDDPEGDGRVAPWVAWMTADAATAIGDFHKADGEEERAITAYRYALHALAIASEEHDAIRGEADAHAFVETAARLHAQLGAWTAARAEFDAARHHLDQALALRAHLEAVDPGEVRSWARAAAWCQRARLGLARGEPDARDPDAWARAVEALRVGYERLGPEALDAFVAALRTVAVLAAWRGDAPAARAARAEEVALRRARLEVADDPVRRADLAVALREVALQAHGDGDLAAARRAAEEAVALMRPVWDGSGRTYVREIALRALVTAGELAHAARDADAGRPLAAEALALGRSLLGSALDPVPPAEVADDVVAEAPPEPTVMLWVAWLEALALAAPYAAVEGPAQAEGLFAEAEAAFARVPEDARWVAALPLAGIEEVRARWLERSGAADAADAVRRRIAELRGSVDAGAEGSLGAFGGGAPA